MARAVEENIRTPSETDFFYLGRVNKPPLSNFSQRNTNLHKHPQLIYHRPIETGAHNHRV